MERKGQDEVWRRLRLTRGMCLLDQPGLKLFLTLYVCVPPFFFFLQTVARKICCRLHWGCVFHPLFTHHTFCFHMNIAQLILCLFKKLIVPHYYRLVESFCCLDSFHIIYRTMPLSVLLFFILILKSMRIVVLTECADEIHSRWRSLLRRSRRCTQ